MPFEKAENMEAFAKIAIYGRQGAGKTRTAAEFATGISSYLVERKLGKGKVGFIDTEIGSNPLVNLFKERGIILEVDRTRALQAVMADIKAAEGVYDVLIIDSVTHIWEQVKEDFKIARKMKPQDRLSLWHWGPLKEPWKEFVTLFLNANVHIIACGRAGFVYEEREAEDGKKEQVVVDTKMRAEGEFEYETALTVEMEIVNVGRLQGKGNRTRVLVNRATVLKDRTDLIQGQQFDAPTFDVIRPWFERLNIGGAHAGVNTKDRSVELYAEGAENDEYRAQQQRNVKVEEIAEILKVIFPSKSDADAKARLDLIERATGRRAWSHVEKVLSRAAVEALWAKMRAFRKLVEAEQAKPDGKLDYKALWDLAEQGYAATQTTLIPDEQTLGVRPEEEAPAVAGMPT